MYYRLLFFHPLVVILDLAPVIHCIIVYSIAQSRQPSITHQ